ncbi:MAG: 30S ribosomal protein S9 [Spirochaetales bacterium]|jgi:small subunit ribosomal protein S9|nr:30S ribosomal protein S9 [Exilispira sp.]NMC67763.1 30S ribosomal protein S9 [Spirochaetales bacterium]
MEKMIMSKGSRKTAIARVILKPGKGNIIINKKEISKYVPQPELQEMIYQPFNLTENTGKYDVTINVKGGGFNAQAEAIRHGISRALVKIDEKYRSILKSNGFLKRDPRMVERKKYGHKKARKSFQFSKR